MAAPVLRVPVGLKLPKAERKALKKHLKSQHTMFRHENITLCEEPTQHIVVGNGGLGNSVRREELISIFSKHGHIIDVIMEPRKPYAFITFSTVEDSLNAFHAVHGKTMLCPEELSVPNVIFYLSFIEEVPGFELPSIPHPPGLILLKNVISEDYEQRLLESIDWDVSDTHEEASSVSQTLKHRRVKHYGYEFIYGINNVDKNKPLNDGVPAVCEEFLNKLIDSNHIHHYPDQLTVNQYLPGQGIPPHIDTHSAFEDGIISLSLGSQVVMDFRHPDGQHIPVLLPQRSVLIMTDESRYVWTHGITPRKADIIPVGESTEQSGTTDSKTATISDRGRRLTLFKRSTRTSFTFRKILHGPCKCKYPKQCDSQQLHSAKSSPQIRNQENISCIPDTDKEAALLEKLHVHEIYEEIAEHFSDTRHKAWPKVADFIKQQTPGSILLDIGCGNGKYLGINSQIYKVGCDRSVNLCQICKKQDFEVLVGDVLALPYRDNCCDAAISIAVIHHLSTVDRRIHAIEEMVRVLHPGGRALISVWALEQELDQKKSNYLKESRIKKKHLLKPDDLAIASHDRIQTHEDESSVDQREKTLAVHVNRTCFAKQDLLVPWHKKNTYSDSKKENKPVPLASGTEACKSDENQAVAVYHRFYHVFKKGELKELVQSVPNVLVIAEYYDKGNWCVILEKTAVQVEVS